MKSPVRFAVLGLLGALFVSNCYRAATQSVVHDEALTWEIYLAGPAANLFQYYDPNHHFLATLLERITTGILGFSELSLRLPTLLAGAWYFATMYRLCLLLFGDGLLFALSVAAACANPLVLDFLVAARGYGLALALLLYAFLQVVRFVLTDPASRGGRSARKLLWTAGGALALSAAANLTMIPPAVALAGVFVWVVRVKTAPVAGKRGRPKSAGSGRAELRWFAIPAAALALLFFISAPVANARQADFYVGVDSLAGSVRNLIAVSFAHNDGIGGINPRAEVWTILLAVVLSFAVVAALVAGVKGRGSGPLLLFAPATLAGSAAILFALHLLLDFPYPADRTGLYFLPLGVLSLAGLAAALPRRGLPLGLVGVTCTVLLAICAFQFAIQWQTSHFYVWRYDADSKAILDRIGASRNGPTRVGISWQLEPSFNFYRVVRNWNWLAPFDRRGPDGDYDYYVLIANDFPLLARRKLHTVWRGPVSGTILARVNPDRRAVDTSGETASGFQPLPFGRGVDQEVDGDRQILGVPADAPPFEGLAASLQDDDEIQIAADAPIPARVGTEVSDSQYAGPGPGGALGPFAGRAVSLVAIRPFEYGRTQ